MDRDGGGAAGRAGSGDVGVIGRKCDNIENKSAF